MPNDTHRKIATALNEHAKKTYHIEGNRYKTNYREKEFEFEMTDEKLDAYIDAASIITEELFDMRDAGRFSSEAFDVDRDSLNGMIKIASAFREDGCLPSEKIMTQLKRIGSLRRVAINSAAWMLLVLPPISSAVFYVAEGMIGDAKDYGPKPIAEFLLRSLLYTEFAND